MGNSESVADSFRVSILLGNVAGLIRICFNTEDISLCALEQLGAFETTVMRTAQTDGQSEDRVQNASYTFTFLSFRVISQT